MAWVRIEKERDLREALKNARAVFRAKPKRQCLSKDLWRESLPISEGLKRPVPLDQSLYLLHPYNSCLVTSIGKDGKPNVMAVAWIIPVSVSPPLLAMSIRSTRYSHRLITETGEFVVNIPTFKMAKKVLMCGRSSGRDCDKFKETRLEPQKAAKLSCPAIEECVAHIECKLVKTIEVGDHSLMIGEIVAAQATKGLFDVTYNLQAFNPCLHLGKNYFTTCRRTRREPKIQLP